MSKIYSALCRSTTYRQTGRRRRRRRGTDLGINTVSRNYIVGWRHTHIRTMMVKFNTVIVLIEICGGGWVSV